MAWYCTTCGGRLGWPIKLGGCRGSQKHGCQSDAERFPRLDGFVSLAVDPDEPEACDIERREVWFNRKRRATSG